MVLIGIRGLVPWHGKKIEWQPHVTEGHQKTAISRSAQYFKPLFQPTPRIMADDVHAGFFGSHSRSVISPYQSRPAHEQPMKQKPRLEAKTPPGNTFCISKHID